MICGLCQLIATTSKKPPIRVEVSAMLVGAYWLGQAEATLCDDHKRQLKAAEEAVEATMNDSDAGAH